MRLGIVNRYRHRLRRTASSSFTFCVMLLLGGCSSSSTKLSFLNPQGPIAAAQRTHLIEIVLVVLIVVVPVIVLAPLYAWRYRFRNKSAPYTPRWEFSKPLEFIIWGVPLAIVILLGIWLAQDTSSLDPYKPISTNKPLRVQVIAYDWKWLFIYPRYGVASIGQLAFPADRQLSLRLTSDTVMQSFFIPALGSQIYTMGGMVSHLHLVAHGPGKFLGENTQYNGNGFASQKFTARAMTSADFKAWLKHVRSTGIPLTPNVYNVIHKRATKSAARHALHAEHMPAGTLYFTDVPSTLFNHVVHSFHGGQSTASALLSGNTSGSAKMAKIHPLNVHQGR